MRSWRLTAKYMKADLRARKVEANMRSVWSSLESHLHWMSRKSSEGKTFHKRCVKDYAKQIYNLSELL